MLYPKLRESANWQMPELSILNSIPDMNVVHGENIRLVEVLFREKRG
jgi:hypothetical protein